MPLQRTLFSLMNSVLKIIYTPSYHSRSTLICPVVGAAYPSPTAIAVKSINTSIPWGTWTEVIRRSANRLIVNFTVSLDYLLLNPRRVALLVFSSTYAIPSYSHRLIREPSVGAPRKNPGIYGEWSLNGCSSGQCRSISLPRLNYTAHAVKCLVSWPERPTASRFVAPIFRYIN